MAIMAKEQALFTPDAPSSSRHIIGVRAEDVVLVQVKTRDWPRPEEREALDALHCPPSTRKVFDGWCHRQCRPDL